MRTLSSTERFVNRRRFWNVRAMPRSTISLGRFPTTDRSSSRTSPELGVYTPVIRLNNVVLPAPLGPMTETISPGSTSKLRFVMACRPPKLLFRWRTLSIAMSGAPLVVAALASTAAVGLRFRAALEQRMRSGRLLLGQRARQRVVASGPRTLLLLVHLRARQPGVLGALLVRGLILALAQEPRPAELGATHDPLGPDSHDHDQQHREQNAPHPERLERAVEHRPVLTDDRDEQRRRADADQAQNQRMPDRSHAPVSSVESRSDARGQDQHADQAEPGGQRVGSLERVAVLLDEHHHRDAQEHAGVRPGPTDADRDEEEEGEEEQEEVQPGGRQVRHPEPAGDTGEEGGEGERHHLVARQSDSHGLGGDLVLANRLQRTTVRAVLELRHHEERERQQRERPPEALAEVAGDAGVPQRTVRERLEQAGRGRQTDDLAEAEGDDRQVVSLEAQAGNPDDQAERHRHQTTEEQRDQEPDPQRLGSGEDVQPQGVEPSFDGESQRERRHLRPCAGRDPLTGVLRQDQQGGDVPADEHEAVVSEGQDAGRAVDQVEADRGDAPDREQRERIVQLRTAGSAHQRQRDGHDRADAQGEQQVAQTLRAVAHQTFSERSSPTMPLGRINSTTMSSAKANVSLYSVIPGKSPDLGKSAVTKFSRNPSKSPPSTAPGRLPMPPITAAANALMPGRIPITAGWLRLPKLRPQSTPPAAASIEPRRKVVAMTRLTFTPIICATSASCAEARIALPSLVRVTKSVSATTRTAVTIGIRKTSRLV